MNVCKNCMGMCDRCKRDDEVCVDCLVPCSGLGCTRYLCFDCVAIGGPKDRKMCNPCARKRPRAEGYAFMEGPGTLEAQIEEAEWNSDDDF